MSKKNGKGLNSFDEKLKRAQRRRNHVARDLRFPKFRQQIIESRGRIEPCRGHEFEDEE